MFVLIYRWRVIPGLEAQFEAGWRRRTEEIARELGGWGSRLHRAEGNVYIAYAQWPDEATWKRASEAGIRDSDDDVRRLYREAIEPGSVETLYAMNVAADLLELRRA